MAVGLTTEELAERIGCDPRWLEILLVQMAGVRLVEWAGEVGCWRLTPRAVERYGPALSALPRRSATHAPSAPGP